jgi:tRNA (guanine-N7-)-methyltransferase
VASALARPGTDHLGIDLVPQAVKFASLRAGQRGLRNLKVAWGDASEFVLERCEPGSIDEAHLYHPQPYYEASKAGRRQLTPAILLAIHRALRPGGTFVFQTDNPAWGGGAGAGGGGAGGGGGRGGARAVARSQGLEVVRAEGRRLDLADVEAAARAAALPEPTFDANRPRRRGGRARRRAR